MVVRDGNSHNLPFSDKVTKCITLSESFRGNICSSLANSYKLICQYVIEISNNNIHNTKKKKKMSDHVWCILTVKILSILVYFDYSDYKPVRDNYLLHHSTIFPV